MASPEIDQVIANCTRFLRGHRPQTLRDQLQEIADSPFASATQDIYGRGGFLADFEREVAELLGKEAAVFMPSGTMAQQIALRIWADRASNPTVAFHPTCHLEIHEQMAYREIHHLDAVLLGQADGLFSLDDLKGIVQPISTLLIELPQREIGGQLPSWYELIAICGEAKSRDMRLHLDGARLWECAPYYQKPYAEIAAPFDSVYVSCYKILGGLPGAVLAGPADFIETAKVWLRRHGGNLVFQGANAISAKIGMERHLPKIPGYVAKAGEIAEILGGFREVEIVPKSPSTNMMHVYFKGDVDAIVSRALDIAREDKVLLFAGLPKSGKMELNVGEGALELSRSELEELFGKLLRV